jgi:DNA-binding NarL/FixJ family response regulator
VISLTIIDKAVEGLDQNHDLDFNATIQSVEEYEFVKEIIDSNGIPEKQVIVFNIKVDGNQAKELINQIRDKHTKVCIFLTTDEHDPLIKERHSIAVNRVLLKNKRVDSHILEFTLTMNESDPIRLDRVNRVLKVIPKKPSRNSSCLTRLTNREVEIMNHLSRGLLYKEIAKGMGISIQTVKSHLKHIYPKLRANNRTEAILKYLQ